jgi:hypothetical protein
LNLKMQNDYNKIFNLIKVIVKFNAYHYKA